jgi:MFS family permease
LFVLTVGTNLPSPLYAVYAQRFGFSPAILTLVFATYAGALVPAMLLAGSAADTWGYRRVAVPGVGLALVGALVLGYADGTGWLFLARAVQGIAVGMSSGALTAALIRTEPSGNHRRASLVTSLATTGGGGLGPMLAGACAEWLPAPTRTCYLLESAALLAVGTGLVLLPAGLGRTGAVWRVSLPQLPSSTRSPFAHACAVGVVGWAVTAVFLSIVPSYLRSLTGDDDLALAGVASGLVLLVAAVVQLPASRIDAHRLQRTGLVILAVGLIFLLGAGASKLLPLVIVAALTAGVGQGLAFMGAVRHANQLAPKANHAAVISAFYVTTYFGVGIPAIGVGLLATATSTTTAVAIFAVVALVASIAVATWNPDFRSDPSAGQVADQPGHAADSAAELSR